MKNSAHSAFWITATALLAIVSSGCSSQARMARHLKRADQYFDAGEYDQAEVEYINVLQMEPSNPQATNRLGIIYFDDGRLESALPYLVKGRELQPDNLEARLRLGLAYFTMGEIKEARDEANSILDQNPQDVEAPLLLAKTALKPEEIKEIAQRLQKLPKVGLGSASVLAALASLDFRQRNIAQAEVELKRAHILDPNSIAVNEEAGVFYWVQQDLPRAEEAFAAAAKSSPLRSSRRLAYAEFQIQTGNLAAGKHSLEEMTQKTPDYLPAWIALAQVAENEKKYDESMALIAKVLARDPSHPEALLFRSRLSLDNGKPGEAIDELKNVVNIYPQSAEVRYQLGLAYLASGETAKATDSLIQATALDPALPDAILLLAGIRIKTDECSVAIASLKQLVRVRPEISRAWFLLATAYSSLDDFDNALAVYDHVEQVWPSDPQAPWLKGLLFVQLKRNREARQAFAQALTLAPGYLPALEQLVNLDLAEKQYSTALQHVQNQLERNPRLPELQLLLARIFFAERDTKQAEACLLKCIELQPGSSTAYFTLAELYSASNQYPKALANLQSGLKLTPNDVQALALMGTIYDEQKNYASARNVFEKLLAIDPKSITAVNNLAYLYSEHFDQLERAYTMAQNAFEHLPSDPHLEDTLGWILFKKHQYSRALDVLGKGADQLPASAEVQFHLGMAHYMMGKEEPARFELRRALQLGRDFPGADEARQCLSVLAIDPKSARADDRATLQKAVADRPDDPVVLARQAAIYEYDGAIDRAIGAYQASWQANPANVTPLMNAIRLYVAQQNTTQAFEMAKAARKLAPNDPEVTHALGHLAYEMHDYEWALSLLEEAAHQKPGDNDILRELDDAYDQVGRAGISAYQKGDFATAEDLIKQSVRKRSGDGEQMYYLGMAQYRLNQRAESKQSLQRALDLDLKTDLAVDAQRILVELKK